MIWLNLWHLIFKCYAHQCTFSKYAFKCIREGRMTVVYRDPYLCFDPYSKPTVFTTVRALFCLFQISYVLHWVKGRCLLFGMCICNNLETFLFWRYLHKLENNKNKYLWMRHKWKSPCWQLSVIRILLS